MPDRAGWAPYCEIMQALLSYMGEQLKAVNITYGVCTEDKVTELSAMSRDHIAELEMVLSHELGEIVAQDGRLTAKSCKHCCPTWASN
jgi:hypothetical protein